MRRLPLLLLLMITPACAETTDPLSQVGAQTYSAEFNAPNGTPVSGFETHYYMASDVNGRILPNERQIYVDPQYCGESTMRQEDGTLVITARKASADAAGKCGYGRGRDFLSGLITTRGIFSQTYGYFEARLFLPLASGTFPAFWMLPVEKTRENLGRLPEFDIVEHLAGPLTLISQGRPFILDRTGTANMTIHAGMANAEWKVTPPSQPKIAPGWHSYGLLWRPDVLIFYIDRKEIWRTPNNGWNDAHYMLINLAISDKLAGSVDEKDYPANLYVDYVRAWALK